ncbi:type VI secretion system tip protein VgrG [Cyanobacteria bacterium FACHB-63]|nr:type VI secretion system tip protein VgrG [Cyanobacteria bacterium FACHB-63]
MNDRTIPTQSTYDVPSFKLLSDGKDITHTYDVLSWVVDRVVNRVPTARIVLRDGSAAEETFTASQADDLAPGKKLDIAVGHDGNDRSIFKGLIVKQSIKVGADGNSTLTLDCKDAMVKLTVGRHSRYFTESTDSDAIETILSQQEYQGLSKDIASTRVKHPEIVQYYATDWDFILSRVEMNGHVLLVEDDKLKSTVPTTSGNALITLTYGANLLEFEAEMDARYQYQAVKAKAWSYTNQALIEAEGTEPTVNTQGNLTGQDLAKVIGLSTWELRHSGLVQDQELKAWADAQMLKSRLAKIQGRVKTKGYADAKPDSLVQLAGMGDRFNGLAYVSGIRHEMRGGTWDTHMQLGLSPQWFYQTADIVERPASGLLPGVNGLQIGVVVQLKEDPTGEDRILVKVPTVDAQAEGTWARIATLDAGKERGSFFRPEIGDEVVLGFLNDDPRDPIVLGMLNSSAKPAPLTAKDENPQKGFFTRSKLKISFDDDKKVIALETPDGNKVTISDDAKGIMLEDQNGNSLTLNDSGIALKSPKDITLEATGKLTLKATQDTNLEGLNVNAKASAQFKAEGSAGAEVSTSAIAILKGSLVQIN